ncbi:MAG: hypothetical protein ACPHOG_05985 [Verrucomicrobiales bacterium]
MARPVGEEDNNKIPKAISRPEGGWFAKIWDERKSGQKKMIKLGRSVPFTVWISPYKIGDNGGLNNEPESEMIESVELIKLPPSKAFTIWAIKEKLTADTQEIIESIPEEAFQDESTEEKLNKELRSTPFTIWTTEQALSDSRIINIKLISSNEKADNQLADVVVVKQDENGSIKEENKNQIQSHPFPVYSVICSLVLLVFIGWMFVKASQLNDLKTQQASLEISLDEKDEIISKAKQDNINLKNTLSDERLKAKSAALNAQEVKRLELKKSNDRLQEKISEIKALSEQMRINKVNFDNQKNTLTKLSDSLRTQISKLKNENTKYIESLDRSQMETEMANKKNDTLLKEVSELKNSLSDSQKNMKSLQLDSDKKVREMENMITKFQESLKKELNEKADIKANLKTSESQLKESQIKNQELRKRITELEEAESSDQ